MPIERLAAVGIAGLLAFTLADLSPRLGFAQGTAAQYQRSEKLGELTRGGVRNESITLHWFGELDRYAWYEAESAAGEKQTLVIDTRTGEKTPAAQSDAYQSEFGQAAAEDLGGNLQPLRRIERSQQAGESTEILFENATKRPVQVVWHDPSGARVDYATLQPGGSHRQHTYAGHVWLLNDPQGKPLAAVRASGSAGRFILREETVAPESVRPRLGGPGRRGDDRGNHSPDQTWRVEIRDHNVVLINVAEQKQTVLTTDGSGDDAYGGPVWWAPDSRHFCLFRTQPGQHRKITLIESAPQDQLQPKTIELDYAKPGDKLDHPRLHVFGIDAQTHHVVDEQLAPNPYSVTHVSWHRDASSVRMLYNQRGHGRLAVLAIDVASGKTRAIIDEVSETFIDYAGKQYLRFLDESNEVIWMSERSGWNHLYRIDQLSGEVKNAITSGDYVVREVVGLDAESRTMLVAVGGFYPDQDPYHLHLIRVPLDGGDPTPLTAGDGNHSWEFSPNDQFLVARYSRVDLPPVTEIRSLHSGRRVGVVERADATQLNGVVGHAPRRLVAKGRHGQSDIHGMIVFPHDFDPQSSQRYPVLELIYAGPHSAHVPKNFGRHLDLRTTADLGFIVVRIDGMGTSHRSKAFHDVCWKNLADAGFPDRIAWMKAAAEQIPQMDLSRVGIWGGSAGGQNAMRALIDHGDFYQAAFADCGCHDNRMDKLWWNELWMGWPVGPHYEQQSNVSGAARVTGKLMLSVGELDRNVDPASTLQVVAALVKANKDFDLLFLPGAGHGAGGSPYGERRRLDFFVRQLWKTEPRHAAVGE